MFAKATTVGTAVVGVASQNCAGPMEQLGEEGHYGSGGKLENAHIMVLSLLSVRRACVSVIRIFSLSSSFKRMVGRQGHNFIYRLAYKRYSCCFRLWRLDLLLSLSLLVVYPAARNSALSASLPH